MPTRLERAHELVARHEDALRHTTTRRTEGRYYTPRGLVRFLVEKTLGPLVAKRSADEILRLKILDPACGAGAFLLGALDFLTEMLAQRGIKDALVADCLIGMDTDADALETARRAIEMASGTAPRGLHHRSALETPLPRVHAIIGNPPYRREKDGKKELERARATDLGRRYSTGKMDLWFLFAHAALEALAEGGRHGFVVPAYWLEARSARLLREHLLGSARLELLVELGARRFFKDVQGRHVLYVCEKTPPHTTHEVTRIEVAPPCPGEPPLDLERPHPAVTKTRTPLRNLLLPDGTIARGGELGRLAALVEARGVRAPFRVSEGVTPGPEAWTASVAERAAAALGTTPEALEHSRQIRRGEGVFVVPEDFTLPGDERPFLLPWAAPAAIPAFPARPAPHAQLLYVTQHPGPKILAHLERFRPALDRRRETREGKRPWWALHWPRERQLFQGPRVLLPRMVARPRAALAEAPLAVGESVLVIVPPTREQARLAAALLNTAPLAAWLLARSKRRGVGIDVSVARAREIPWPRALLDAPGEVEAVARALEAGRSADALAWALYGVRASSP